MLFKYLIKINLLINKHENIFKNKNINIEFEKTFLKQNSQNMKSSIKIILIILVIVNCVFGSKAPGNETLQTKSNQSLKELAKNHLPPIKTGTEVVKDNFQNFKKTINSLKDWTMEKLKRVENYGSEVIKKLNKPMIKNARDICLWKICSRPLKNRENKKTQIPITIDELKKKIMKGSGKVFVKEKIINGGGKVILKEIIIQN